MSKNALLEQSQQFATNMELLCQKLTGIQGISNTLFQLRKASSSIYANISEAQYPQSLSDMLSKFKIALKESSECESWLKLLYNCSYIDEAFFKEYRNACGRIRRLLIASCKTIESKVK